MHSVCNNMYGKGGLDSAATPTEPSPTTPSDPRRGCRRQKPRLTTPQGGWVGNKHERALSAPRKHTRPVSRRASSDGTPTKPGTKTSKTTRLNIMSQVHLGCKCEWRSPRHHPPYVLRWRCSGCPRASAPRCGTSPRRRAHVVMVLSSDKPTYLGRPSLASSSRPTPVLFCPNGYYSREGYQSGEISLSRSLGLTLFQPEMLTTNFGASPTVIP